jgi:hypothetical protein
MIPISKMRFEALAGYCRLPQAAVFSQELEWYEAGGEALLAFLILDRIDGDYGGIVLARDEKERYRFIGGTEEFSATRSEARHSLAAVVEQLLPKVEKERLQGDSVGPPVDFFSPLVPKERLHPSFVQLRDLEGYSPARDIIEPMMRWYRDLDGNFIEQFQTTGFDSRIFELYLFATFVEAGYALSDRTAVPDFTCTGLGGEFCVEATTVNPSRDAQGQIIAPPPVETKEQLIAFQKEYMPIKYAGPLTAKLAKKYWERENVSGKPLLFAIADFHAPASMMITRNGLPIYLYGNDYTWKHDDNGKLVITPFKVASHTWGKKVVPSGFFNLPGAENVSAVLFTNAGTVAKFDRIGLLAGFGSKRVELLREGLAADPDPNASKPRPFRHRVNDADYSETWVEGVDIYHNPNALHPFDPDLLPGATHSWLRVDGQIESIGPAWQPLSSRTLIAIRDTAP